MTLMIAGILISFALAAVALALFYRSLPEKRGGEPPEGWYK